MRTATAELPRVHDPETGELWSSDRQRLATFLRRWRQRLGFLSVLAALPGMLISNVIKARADEKKKPETNVGGLPARIRERLNKKRTNLELLKRQSAFHLPHQTGNLALLAAFAGTDDCPGRPILGGTYTAASPYTDTGDTTGANDTFSRIHYYYYYTFDGLGPDQVYSFTLSGRGAAPTIEVSTTSGTYKPLIYVLYGGFGGACPSGTGATAFNTLVLNDSRWSSGNIATLNRDQMNYLPLNVPLHLVIDSASNDSTGAGPYTVRMQDVSIGPLTPCTSANPIDCTDFFLRQQYLDFLGREPDPAGYSGWQNILNNCGVTVPQPCDRIEVASAFFRSAEFQGRGYFIYRFYSTVSRIPRYDEFAPDFSYVQGFQSEFQVETGKARFVDDFIARPYFQNRYATTFNNPPAYVDALLQTVGLPNHPSRQSWINTLNPNSASRRAQVLRSLVESNEVYQKYYNEAFVIMQYFGFLQRTADGQYLQWIQTMNQNGGDYRVMINGFLNSAEYRRRFEH